MCGGTTLLAFKDFTSVINKKKATTEVYKESLFFLSLSVNIPINKLELALRYRMHWLFYAQMMMSFALDHISHPPSLLVLTLEFVVHMKLEII